MRTSVVYFRSSAGMRLPARLLCSQAVRHTVKPSVLTMESLSTTPACRQRNIRCYWSRMGFASERMWWKTPKVADTRCGLRSSQKVLETPEVRSAAGQLRPTNEFNSRQFVLRALRVEIIDGSALFEKGRGSRSSSSPMVSSWPTWQSDVPPGNAATTADKPDQRHRAPTAAQLGSCASRVSAG